MLVRKCLVAAAVAILGVTTFHDVLARPRGIPGTRAYARRYAWPAPFTWHRGFGPPPAYVMPAPAAAAPAVQPQPLPPQAETVQPAPAPAPVNPDPSAAPKVAPPSAVPGLLFQPPAASTTPAPYATKLNLNTATLDQIQRLPGVGPSLGANILSGRPYRTIGELARQGVPFATIEKIAPLITLEP